MKDALKNAGYHTMVFPLGADLVRNVSAALRLLWGGVVLVLLIAGVNITNLSLVRANEPAQGTGDAPCARRGAVARDAATRHRDAAADRASAAWPASRSATGASTRSTWLGLSDIPRANEIHIDGTVIAFTLTLAVVLGLIVGAVPALQLAGVNLNAVLREEGRTRHGRAQARVMRGRDSSSRRSPSRSCC